MLAWRKDLLLSKRFKIMEKLYFSTVFLLKLSHFFTMFFYSHFSTVFLLNFSTVFLCRYLNLLQSLLLNYKAISI